MNESQDWVPFRIGDRVKYKNHYATRWNRKFSRNFVIPTWCLAGGASITGLDAEPIDLDGFTMMNFCPEKLRLKSFLHLMVCGLRREG